MIAFPESASSATPSRDLERLGDEIAGLASHVDAATYRLLVRLREFDERDGWSRDFASCAHWLSWRAGIAPGAAREKVRVARALADLPGIGAAMERGELSFSKVRALTRIATPGNEDELLELARHATASQVERIVRAWRRLDREAEAEAERERHEARHLSVHADEDGSYVVRGRLDPEVGALLERALDAAAKALYDVDRRVAGKPTEAPTAAQRRADAIGLLVELALQQHDLAARRPALVPERGALPPERQAFAPEREAEEPVHADDDRLPPGAARSLGRAGRVQIVLHVDAETLRADSDAGQAVLGGGVRVSAETSRRLACDASVIAMTHGATGNVLDVGRRRRTVPPAIRRALEHRDRGCRFPGCGNRYVDAHHLHHWADGGATQLDNLVLLCRRHHRLVHEDGYHVRRLDGGEHVFSTPDGRTIPNAPAMPAHSCRCQAEEAQTGSREPTGALGARFDLGWVMRVVYASCSPPTVSRER